MGDMVKYKIEIEPNDLIYIGALLDKQPHGDVARIIASIQPQITAQDAAELARRQAEFDTAVQSEIERRNASPSKET